jgi:minor extracellular serine protease Vpr
MFIKRIQPLLIFLTCLLSFPYLSFAQVNEEISIIVEVEDNPYKWKKFIEDYHPFVEVVQVYDTLLNALALKGDPKDLNKIEKEDFVESVYQNKTYEVPAFHEANETKQPLPKRPVKSKYTGKGVKIGVIDTGIDYEHPDLKKNYKGGYDVVDLDEDPMETLPEQGIPTIHGTHVAGIIAADGKMQGVAPDAEIYAYRALGPGGVGTSVGIIAALEKAVEDGMDIINLSLGSTVNSPDWPTSIAVNRAIDMGVAVVIANGNEGPEQWTVSSPATSVHALSVGASITEMEIPYVTVNLEDRQVPLQPMAGSAKWDLKKDYPMVDGGLGKESIENARDKIVIMERGEIPFSEKAMKAYEAGAKAVIIYNNEEGLFQGGLQVSLPIPVAGVSKEDGEWLLEQMKKGRWLTTSYTKIKDKLANFSSKGPVVHNWDIKPEILAPGVQIISTVPDGKYMDLQGTSMAAPYVAGALALIKEAHPNWGPKELKAAVLSTAKPYENEEGKKYDPVEQGMGEIQIEKSIHPEILIYESRLTFGKMNEKENHKKIDMVIENRSKKVKKFSFDYPKRQKGIEWKIPRTFYVEPGEQKNITVELIVDTKAVAEGLHQGWLDLQNGSETISLPYIFVNQTADYPKIAGFELVDTPFEKDVYTYTLYLPDGAEELYIDLYDPDTLRYLKTIVQEEDIKEGMFEGKIKKSEIAQGEYLVFVKVQNGENSSSFVTEFQNF